MKKLVPVVVGVLVLSACTIMPVHNVRNKPYYHPRPTVVVSYTQIENVIIGVVIDRGWNARVIRPGLIEARIFDGYSSATIHIEYTSDVYSIRYIDSNNMRYKNGNIHRNYNNWVETLSRDIEGAMRNADKRRR